MISYPNGNKWGIIVSSNFIYFLSKEGNLFIIFGDKYSLYTEFNSSIEALYNHWFKAIDGSIPTVMK